MQFHPHAGLDITVLANGDLSVRRPDGDRRTYGRAAAAVWIALRRNYGDPDVTSMYLADMWDTSVHDVHEEVLEWVREWLAADLISEIWNCSLAVQEGHATSQ